MPLTNDQTKLFELLFDYYEKRTEENAYTFFEFEQASIEHNHHQFDALRNYDGRSVVWLQLPSACSNCVQQGFRFCLSIPSDLTSEKCRSISCLLCSTPETIVLDDAYASPCRHIQSHCELVLFTHQRRRVLKESVIEVYQCHLPITVVALPEGSLPLKPAIQTSYNVFAYAVLRQLYGSAHRRCTTIAERNTEIMYMLGPYHYAPFPFLDVKEDWYHGYAGEFCSCTRVASVLCRVDYRPRPVWFGTDSVERSIRAFTEKLDISVQNLRRHDHNAWRMLKMFYCYPFSMPTTTLIEKSYRPLDNDNGPVILLCDGHLRLRQRIEFLKDMETRQVNMQSCSFLERVMEEHIERIKTTTLRHSLNEAWEPHIAPYEPHPDLIFEGVPSEFLLY